MEIHGHTVPTENASARVFSSVVHEIFSTTLFLECQYLLCVCRTVPLTDTQVKAHTHRCT